MKLFNKDGSNGSASTRVQYKRSVISANLDRLIIAGGLLVFNTAFTANKEVLRWENDIASFEQSDKENPPKQGRTLFIGSSSIGMWKTLSEDFQGALGTVIKRGFGGSQITDSVHYADRIILPYKPRQIVLYAGENDINTGKSPETVLADFQQFVKVVHDQLPKTRIAFISIKPSIKRWHLSGKMAKANSLVSAACSSDKRLDFIDIWEPMLGEDDRPMPDLFIQDGVHLNAEGYGLWTSILKPILRQNMIAYRSSPDRWENSINTFENSDNQQMPAPGGILFIGSSSIGGWSTLKEDFAGYPVINRGFGGSQINDSIHFANRIVHPYKPRQIVLYAGDNDIAVGKSPETVLADFRKFTETVHSKLPKARIAFIAIKPSISRWNLSGKMAKANSLVSTVCSGDKRLDFIDIWKPMLGADGKPMPDLFVQDGLHLNATGYALWTSIVKPYVVEWK